MKNMKYMKDADLLRGLHQLHVFLSKISLPSGLFKNSVNSVNSVKILSKILS
jgi:hypothetical protein